MQEDHLERLARQLPARSEQEQMAVHGAIDSPESAVEFLLFVKNVGNECVGMNRRVRLSLEFDLHVSLSLLSPPEAVHGFVGFALHFFLPLRLAALVEF